MILFTFRTSASSRCAAPGVLRQAKQLLEFQTPIRHCSNTCRNSSFCHQNITTAPPAGTAHRKLHSTTTSPAKTTILIDGKETSLSPILLRDLCQCPRCVHESTRQRLYSTAEIPATIEARSIRSEHGRLHLQWTNDVPGFGEDHKTSLSVDMLRQIRAWGSAASPFHYGGPKRVLWSDGDSAARDFEYDAYMRDDEIVFEVAKHLQSHGLVFITGTPSVEESVAAIGERIGPVRDTFYGRTWDVRTVPQAINAAYTSGDLGFHTDLLYFRDPPHLQLLHCIQSSSHGGASVFADAFKAAIDLYETDEEAFNVLAQTPVTYHYEHPGANLYAATKPVFDLRSLRIGAEVYETLSEFLEAWEDNRQKLSPAYGTEIPALSAGDCLEKINWGPPFLAPFSLEKSTMERNNYTSSGSGGEALSTKMDAWHSAAAKFNALLNRPENLYERLMKPGECVIFDNTRALHGRKAFESGDVGKARWLRGAYVDRDPYWSKMKVLKHKESSRVGI